jgi:hypothetical protein
MLQFHVQVLIQKSQNFLLYKPHPAGIEITLIITGPAQRPSIIKRFASATDRRPAAGTSWIFIDANRTIHLRAITIKPHILTGNWITANSTEIGNIIARFTYAVITHPDQIYFGLTAKVAPRNRPVAFFAKLQVKVRIGYIIAGQRLITKTASI